MRDWDALRESVDDYLMREYYSDDEAQDEMIQAIWKETTQEEIE